MIKQLEWTLGLVLIALLVGCGPSTDEISSKVMPSMQHKFDSDPQLRDLHLKVQSVTVIHSNGNLYQGLAEISSHGVTHEVSVKITADGENMMWETEPSALLVFLADGASSLSPPDVTPRPESLDDKAIRLVRRDYDIKPDQPIEAHQGTWSATEESSDDPSWRYIDVEYSLSGLDTVCRWTVDFPVPDANFHTVTKINGPAKQMFYEVPIGSHGNS
jgi:hypothetical protein